MATPFAGLLDDEMMQAGMAREGSLCSTSKKYLFCRGRCAADDDVISAPALAMPGGDSSYRMMRRADMKLIDR